MKKIGILFGQERSFPAAFVEHGNRVAPEGISFEFVTMGATRQSEVSDYAVILDRISQDVPFYRAALKHAAVKGCAVINNPFWWSAEDKLTANAMADEVGVPVPKTVLLPSKDHPDDTTSDSFTNLRYPLLWDEIFEHVGFPAFMKPNTGGGWKSVYKVNNPEELFAAYGETEQLNMLLQESIDFTEYFRCYGIGGKHVRMMRYEPRNPFHERYVRDGAAIDVDLLKKLEDYVLRLCRVLGYDFNTVELAVRNGVPVAIDFTNPAPDADLNSVGQDNFDWVVEHAVQYAIERAKAHKPGQENLTWGTFVQRSSAAYANASGPKKTSRKPKAAKPKPSKPVASKTVAKPRSTPSKSTPEARAVERAPAKGPRGNAVAKDETPSKVPAAKRATVKAPAKGVPPPPKSTQPAPLTGKAAADANKELLSRIGKAASGKQDDLKRIVGVGPKLEKILNDLGVLTFAQVAQMKARDYDLVDALLTNFRGRGKRDKWSQQAKKLK